ncbi:MAG: hypothetical protein ACXWBP_01375, partial [Limisphaerales bacterium]
MNRRKFLKITATSAIAAGLSQVTARSETARPVRVGFIGVGNRGSSLLHTILSIPGVDIAAICDIDTSHLARAQ